MAIDYQKLCDAYNQITDRILEITLKPKPDYNIDGQNIKWADYLERLTKAQANLKTQIDQQNADEPYEIEQQIIT